MKAAKYIIWHAPYERIEEIDDLFLFFKIRRTRITMDLYSLMLTHSKANLHEYIRKRVIKFTHSGLIPSPIIQQSEQSPKPPQTKTFVRNAEPAKGLSPDDPIKKTSRLNRMNRIAISNHPKDDDYEYGLSDW